MKKGYAILLASGLLTGVAAAQDTKATQAASPKAEAKKGSEGEVHCPCCGQMMGKGHGMKDMGDGGMMGAGGGMCGHMSGMATVRVEQTADGAVVRLTAKDPAKVAQVQEHARMMGRCMSGNGMMGAGGQDKPRK